MSRFHELVVSDVRRETRDSMSIGFAIPPDLASAFAFMPGQYVTLRATIAGEDVRRPYSICAAPSDGEIRVGIKLVPGGVFSIFATTQLKVGDRVQVSPPEGRFTPRITTPGRHVLAIAAGSGITPILSIMKAALTGDATTRVSLIYGNRTTASIMFLEAIENLKNQFLTRLTVVHVLSREAQDVAVLAGRIDAAKLAALAAGAIDFSAVDEAFLCGPEPLVVDVRSALGRLGVAADRIRIELFTPAAPARNRPAPAATPVPQKAVICRVTATVDGKRHTFDLLEGDEGLIDAAARIGLDLPFSCKGGMCCTCRCKLVAGQATMVLNYSLEPWEMQAGFILGCQARPSTPQLVVDFDQM